MQVTYQELQPSAALRPYVDSFWLHSFQDAPSGEWSPIQRCLPFGMVELIVHLDDNKAQASFGEEWHELPSIFMAGMYRDTVLIRAGAATRKFGIRMKPEMFSKLFKAPSSVLYSNYTELGNIIGRDADQLAEKLMAKDNTTDLLAAAEAYLLSQLARYKDEHDYVIEAAKLIRSSKGNISIEAVSKSVYVSVRQLQRAFRDTIGTSPKTYGRIVRFRNAYLHMQRLEQSGGWTGISYDLGYADQAHLIREFKEFSGTIPNLMRLDTGHAYGKVV